MSKRSCDGIFDVLSRHYSRVSVKIVNDIVDLESLTGTKPDLVFLGMKFVTKDHSLGHDDPGKIWISNYLDKYRIAYTGSNQKAHKLELNKHLAKQCALDAGLKTSPFYVSAQNQLHIREEMLLTFPLFIKPSDRGGGRGIDEYSVAHNFEQLESKIKWIHSEIQSDSLVEEYLPGREFSVAILKDGQSNQFLVMPMELIAPENKNGERLLSSGVKKSDSENTCKVVDNVLKDKITDLAIKVFHILGARDYGRIDIRLDKIGTPHFLEANLIPSLIDNYGNFPKSCLLNLNMGFESMILNIVKLGLVRAKNVPVPLFTSSIA